MPTKWAYKLELLETDPMAYGRVIVVYTFDTVGEMSEVIKEIFEYDQQDDCYYKLTDWLGNTKVAGFTTEDIFWSRWVEDFYFLEEEHLMRLDKKESSAEGG